MGEGVGLRVSGGRRFGHRLGDTRCYLSDGIETSSLLRTTGAETGNLIATRAEAAMLHTYHMYIYTRPPSPRTRPRSRSHLILRPLPSTQTSKLIENCRNHVPDADQPPLSGAHAHAQKNQKKVPPSEFGFSGSLLSKRGGYGRMFINPWREEKNKQMNERLNKTPFPSSGPGHHLSSLTAATSFALPGSVLYDSPPSHALGRISPPAHSS